MNFLWYQWYDSLWFILFYSSKKQCVIIVNVGFNYRGFTDYQMSYYIDSIPGGDLKFVTVVGQWGPLSLESIAMSYDQPYD